MSDALTREQYVENLDSLRPPYGPIKNALKGHDAAQRATIARLEADQAADLEHIDTRNKIIAGLEARLAAVTEERDMLQMNNISIAKVEAERDELQRLFDLQHTRTMEADRQWQAAHNKPDTFPDLGELIRWLMAERNAALAKVADHQAAVEMIASSRDVLLNTFCQWQVEYGKGKMALRQLPHVEQQRDEALAKVRELEAAKEHHDHL